MSAPGCPISCELDAEFQGHDTFVPVLALPLQLVANEKLIIESTLNISPSPTLIIYFPDEKTAKIPVASPCDVARLALTENVDQNLLENTSTLEQNLTVTKFTSSDKCPSSEVDYTLSLFAEPTFSKDLGAWESVRHSTETGVLHFQLKTEEKQSLFAAKDFLNDTSIVTLSVPQVLPGDELLDFRNAVVKAVFRKAVNAKLAVYCPKATKNDPHTANIVCSSKPFFLRCAKHKDLELDTFPAPLLCWFPEVSIQRELVCSKYNIYRFLITIQYSFSSRTNFVCILINSIR